MALIVAFDPWKVTGGADGQFTTTEPLFVCTLAATLPERSMSTQPEFLSRATTPGLGTVCPTVISATADDRTAVWATPAAPPKTVRTFLTGIATRISVGVVRESVEMQWLPDRAVSAQVQVETLTDDQ